MLICPLWANSGARQRTIGPYVVLAEFDHLVGGKQKFRRTGQAEHLWPSTWLTPVRSHTSVAGFHSFSILEHLTASAITSRHRAIPALACRPVPPELRFFETNIRCRNRVGPGSVFPISRLSFGKKDTAIMYEVPAQQTARTGSAKSLTLAAMSLGYGVVQLDVTIVNTALNSIGISLGGGISELQ